MYKILMFIYEVTNNLNLYYSLSYWFFSLIIIQKIDIKYDTYIIIIVTSIT